MLRALSAEGSRRAEFRKLQTISHTRWGVRGAVALAVAGSVSASAGELATVRFLIPQVGISYLAYLPPESPLVGRPVVAARIYLNLETFAGSNAANFFTDVGLPIVPDAGNTNVVFLTGRDLNWSGAGVFEYFEETSRFNGQFVSVFYGGETPGFDFAGQVLEGTRIEVDYLAEPTLSPGDLNCDGIVSVGDIGPFVLALTDPEAYAGQFPDCDISTGDINGDNVVTVGDIGGFVALLIPG